jgi:four helix bundle protein
MIRTFKELLVWRKAHELTLLIYKVTASFPRSEEFGLSSQMRRCSYSIPSNLAEGFKRKSRRDSCHFYNIAEGSLEELKYQTILAKDLKYVVDKQYNEIEILSEEVGKLLNGWIKSQK